MDNKQMSYFFYKTLENEQNMEVIKKGSNKKSVYIRNCQKFKAHAYS
jgi:hypothetical protein